MQGVLKGKVRIFMMAFFSSLTLCLPVSSADNLGNQFVPGSGPTNHRA